MYSTQICAHYLNLYLDYTIDKDKWIDEIKKLGNILMNKTTYEFAVREIRHRVGFCVHCCKDGWRPTNAVAFFWGCFRNEAYKSQDWVKWMEELIYEDEQFRKLRTRLASEESIAPQRMLSYPPGRMAHRLIMTGVQNKTLSKVEDKLLLELDQQRLLHPEAGRINSKGKELIPYGINIPSEGDIKPLDPNVPLDHTLATSSKGDIEQDNIPYGINSTPIEGAEMTEKDIRDYIALLHDQWQEKVAHFLAIYGPRNVIFAHETYSEAWRRVDFSSLYFVERFLLENMGSAAISKGKIMEVNRLPAELLTSGQAGKSVMG